MEHILRSVLLAPTRDTPEGDRSLSPGLREEAQETDDEMGRLAAALLSEGCNKKKRNFKGGAFGSREADGLVKRTDDPADRRAVCAEVSALGRKRHAAGAKAVNAVYQAVARELSPMDPQALKRALNAVR